MYNSSEEALEDTERHLSPKQVEQELKRHGYRLCELQADLGHRDFYSPFEVMAWMGY